MDRTVEGQNGPMTTTFTFKADGDKLTGTVSGRNGEAPIEDGKIDGNNVWLLLPHNGAEWREDADEI